MHLRQVGDSDAVWEGFLTGQSSGEEGLDAGIGCVAQGSALTAECGGWKIMEGWEDERRRENGVKFWESGRASKRRKFFLGGGGFGEGTVFFYIVLAVSLSGDILVTQKTRIRDFLNMDRT